MQQTNIKHETLPVPGDKVFSTGCPIWHSQVQQLRVDALKDARVGVEVGDGLIWGPFIEAGEGGGVLLGVELGPHHRHQNLLWQPACLHTCTHKFTHMSQVFMSFIFQVQGSVCRCFDRLPVDDLKGGA